MNLISEKSILYVIWRIVVQNYHEYATYHFTDLVVDETLPNDVENEIVIVQFFCIEVKYVPLRLCIFCFQIFRIVVKVVGTNKIFATSVDLLQQFLVVFFMFFHLTFTFTFLVPRIFLLFFSLLLFCLILSNVFWTFLWFLFLIFALQPYFFK